MGLALLMKSVSFIRKKIDMMINGINVNHKGSAYRLYLPDGAVIADLRFPVNGKTFEEARVVKIVIKHMKGVWGVR